jgi:hypothetical protein
LEEAEQKQKQECSFWQFFCCRFSFELALEDEGEEHERLIETVQRPFIESQKGQG